MYNFDPGVERVYVHLLELWPMASFHAQIWQFLESACISESPVGHVGRVKINSISTPLDRKSLYVQLLELGQLPSFMPKYRKSARISGTAAHGGKKSSISRPPGIERECMCNFWNFWPMAKFVLKQSVKARGPLVSI